MPTSYKINGYLKCVSDQIRWKAAKEPICMELEEHILDQRDAFIQDGDSEEVAIDKAIEEMGDPYIVGGQLDSTHRPRPNLPVLILTGMLFSLGLLLRFFSRDLNVITPATIVGPIIALAVFIGTYLLDFTIFQKHSKWLMIGVLACATLITFFYPMSWVNGKFPTMYSISLFFPLALACLIYSQRNKGYKGAGICFGACVIIMLLANRYSSITSILMLTPTMFSLIIYAAIKDWFGVGKGKGKWIIIGVSVLLTITALILVIVFPVGIINRIMYWDSYAPLNFYRSDLFTDSDVRKLLAGTKFIGTGITSSVDTWTIAGYYTNTYFLTHIIHQYGWLAFIGIMAVFCAFVGAGFYYCAKQKSFLGKLVSYAIMGTITMQAVLYVFDNLGIGVSTSAVMPLISPGNSFIVLNMALIGFMLSVFKTSNILVDGRASSFLFLKKEKGSEKENQLG